MTAVMLKLDHFHNPLDIAEMVMLDRDLAFERSSDGDLFVESAGMWGAYRSWFSWQEETGNLSLSCGLENKIPKATFGRVCELLAHVNERLWMGFFSYDSEQNSVVFRHTLLLNANEGQLPGQEMIEQMLDTATHEWERFYPALQSVMWAGRSAKEALEYALFETVAEA